MGGGVVDTADAGPKGSGVAHSTALGARVEDTSREVMGAEATAGFSDGDNFSVGAGVTIGEDTVRSLTNDSAILDYDRAEGTAGLFHETADSTQFDCTAHEAGMSGGIA